MTAPASLSCMQWSTHQRLKEDRYSLADAISSMLSHLPSACCRLRTKNPISAHSKNLTTGSPCYQPSPQSIRDGELSHPTHYSTSDITEISPLSYQSIHFGGPLLGVFPALSGLPAYGPPFYRNCHPLTLLNTQSPQIRGTFHTSTCEITSVSPQIINQVL